MLLALKAINKFMDFVVMFILGAFAVVCFLLVNSGEFSGPVDRVSIVMSPRCAVEQTAVFGVVVSETTTCR